MFVVSPQDCQSTRRNLKKVHDQNGVVFHQVQSQYLYKKDKPFMRQCLRLFSQWQLPLNSGKNTTNFTLFLPLNYHHRHFLLLNSYTFSTEKYNLRSTLLHQCISSLFNCLSQSNYAVKNTRVYHYIIYHSIPLLGLIYTKLSREFFCLWEKFY